MRTVQVRLVALQALAALPRQLWHQPLVLDAALLVCMAAYLRYSLGVV